MSRGGDLHLARCPLAPTPRGAGWPHDPLGAVRRPSRRPAGDGIHSCRAGEPAPASVRPPRGGAGPADARGPGGLRGGDASIVLGHAGVEGYAAEPTAFHGAVVGRYANRIAGARFSLDGTLHRLDAYEGDTCQHGGADGFHRRNWSLVAVDESSVTLRLVSPDGDRGFPGELTAEARYAVARGRVVVELTVTTIAPTVVSLAGHAHFNLCGGGAWLRRRAPADGRYRRLPAHRRGVAPGGRPERRPWHPRRPHHPGRARRPVRDAHPQVTAPIPVRGTASPGRRSGIRRAEPGLVAVAGAAAGGGVPVPHQVAPRRPVTAR